MVYGIVFYMFLILIAELTEEATNILKNSLGLTKFNSQRPANPRFKGFFRGILVFISVDWPLGRAIAIQKDKKYFVQVNKEEHFEIVFHKSNNIDFLKVKNRVK